MFSILDSAVNGNFSQNPVSQLFVLAKIVSVNFYFNNYSLKTKYEY